MWLLVTMLTAACVGSTVAPAPCSSHPDIPCLLSKFKECYVDGQPPAHLVGYGVRSTVTYISNDVLPAGAKCVSGSQTPGYGLVNITFQSGSLVQVTYKQQVKEKFISEQDPQEIYYSIWPIRNQHHVYFYYRCVATKGEKGTEEPMVAIYVECGYENDSEAQKEIATALKCVERLNITNLVHFTPCDGKSGCSINP